MAEQGRKQVGVIPYYYKNNRYRFVLVTSRKKPSKWIFPKGKAEEDLSDREAALKEAYEEAGLLGRLKGDCIRISGKNGDVSYKFYPMRISRICARWPERGLRRRCFVKSKRMRSLLPKTPYREAVEIFLRRD